MIRLRSITLQNFQVFGTLTKIPLGKLSLFFGPNSAGKSAVRDALAVLRSIFAPAEFLSWYRYKSLGGPGALESLHRLVERHWRRVARDEFSIGPLIIEVQLSASQGDFFTSRGTFLALPESNADYVLRVRLAIDSPDEDSPFTLEAHLDDELVFAFSNGESATLPIVPKLYRFPDGLTAKALRDERRRFPVIPISISKGLIKFRGPVSLGYDLSLEGMGEPTLATQSGGPDTLVVHMSGDRGLPAYYGLLRHFREVVAKKAQRTTGAATEPWLTPDVEYGSC